MAKATTIKTNDNRERGGTHPFIDGSTAWQAYDESNKWLKPYFDPINELERIARNKPSDKVPKHLPKVTDGTMAAIVQDSPKRAIQQLATGIVKSIEHPEWAKLADIAHRYIILPSYNRQGTALQKHWIMNGKSQTWGSAVSFTFLTTTNGVVHTDFSIPYRKDVITEKGKVFGPDSKTKFLRAWMQKSDIKSIIRREKWLQDQDKSYKSDWNLDLLAKLLDTPMSTKPADLQTPAEVEKGDGNSGGYEFIHCFQEGIGAEFYTFCTNFAGNQPLRTKVNKDPRGKDPLDFEYCNIDLSNPIGRGSVELSGGVQNLIDQQMQMFQFMTTLEMAPPLQVWGNVKKSTLNFRPNAIWDMGTVASNKVEPYVVSNNAIAQFSNNYGLLKSQILNLNSAQDHSISGSDAPGQSKTQAGVQASESRLGVSDNYLRLQHETWFNDQAETSINQYFSEITIDKEVTLKPEDLKEFKKDEKLAEYLKGDVLTIPISEINDVSFNFTVDASSSEVKEDADNAERLQETYALMVNDPDPAVQEAKLKVLKALVTEIGAQGTDDIFPEEEEGAEGQPQGPDPNALMQQLMPQVQQMVGQMIEEAKMKPVEDPTLSLIKALGLKFDELPEGARQIVLEHTGLNTGEPTPSTEDRATKQEMEIDAQAHKQALDVHNAGQSTAQAEASNAQNQAQFEATQASQAQENEANRQAQAQQAQMSAQASQSTGASSSSSAGNDTPQPSASGQPEESPELQQAEEGLTPEEMQVVHALIQQGFSDDDVEQAITMLREGRPPQEILQILGGKYATA